MIDDYSFYDDDYDYQTDLWQRSYPLNTYTPQQAPQPTDDSAQKKGFARGVVGGALGGTIVSASVWAALVLTGTIGSTTVAASGSSASGQTLTIATASEDTTVAEAVSAKALPSVVSIDVVTAEGEAYGSGVILDTDGNILTNYHVIEGAQEISVTIEGQSLTATVVGYDESSDLAVVHVELGGLLVTPIEVADSDSLIVGEWVMAIGSPYGLEQSVSQGIVSALTRSTLMESSSGYTAYANLIQTDAAVNPGNSGGALVNDQGQLVGINTLIESTSGDNSGIAFAIPSNYAVEIANKIIAGEQVTHAYIGVSMQTVTANNAQRNGLSVSAGAYVAEVASGGPAEAAGVQVGDIIVAVDGTSIASSDEMILAVRSHEVGETVQLTIVRGSQELTVDVTLGSDETLQAESAAEEQSSQMPGDGSGFGSEDSFGDGNSLGGNSGFGPGDSGSGLGFGGGMG